MNKNPLQWGIVDNNKEGKNPDGTTYFIKFEFSTKDVAERPLDVALAVRDRTLQIMQAIKSSYLPDGTKTKD